jgi:hypothetical protein
VPGHGGTWLATGGLRLLYEEGMAKQRGEQYDVHATGVTGDAGRLRLTSSLIVRRRVRATAMLAAIACLPSLSN